MSWRGLTAEQFMVWTMNLAGAWLLWRATHGWEGTWDSE